MEMRSFGGSGLAVSPFALGTLTFGAEVEEKDAFAILDEFVESGGNLIDTADVYNQGRSEEIIGRWLRSSDCTDLHPLIATKARYPMSGDPNAQGLSRRHLRRALDASLRRLAIDHIDLYQVHAWDPLTPLEETLSFMDEAMAAGKIGYYGLSNFTGWQLSKAVGVAARHGWRQPISLQPQYNILARNIEFEIIPAALDFGLAVLPWSPLAAGWLTGKYRRDDAPSTGTRFGEDPNRGMSTWEERRSNERAWAVIAALQRIASDHGASPAQVALAWLRVQPGVTSIVLGVRSPSQLRENLQSISLVLTPDELHDLGILSQPIVDAYPYGEPGRLQRQRNI